jgi:hypothetical protein
MNQKIEEISNLLYERIFVNNENISLSKEYPNLFNEVKFQDFIIYQINYFPQRYSSILYLELLEEWDKIDDIDIVKIINGTRNVIDLVSLCDFFIHFLKINILEIALLSSHDVYFKLALFEYYRYYYVDSKLDVCDEKYLKSRGHSLKSLENIRNTMNIKTISSYDLNFINKKNTELKKEAIKKYGIFRYYKREFDLKNKIRVGLINLYRRIRYW